MSRECALLSIRCSRWDNSSLVRGRTSISCKLYILLSTERY